MNTVTRMFAANMFAPVTPRAHPPRGLKTLCLPGAMVLVAGLLVGFVDTCQESVLRGERLEQQFRAHGRSEPVQLQAPATVHASAQWARS
jgi:hypothetical protein